MLHKAAREATPYKTHRAQLERRKERLERQQEADAKKVDEIKGKIEELHNQLAETETAIAERSKALVAVDGELKELLLKAIDPSQTGGSNSNDDPHHAWQTVTSTMAAMASMPGVPVEWGTALQGLLAQIHAATAAMGAAAAAGGSPGVSTPTPPAPLGAAAQNSLHGPGQGQQEERLTMAEAGDLREHHCQVWQAHRQLEEQRQLNEQLRAQQLQQQDGAGGGANATLQPQHQPVLGLGKLAADGAAATDQGRAVGAAAREAAAAAAARAEAATAAGASSREAGDARRERGGGKDENAEAVAAQAVSEAEAATTGAATAASQVPQSNETGNDDGFSDYTGGRESSDEDKDNMELEAIVGKVPADQKAAVRAMLAARKTRLARRIQRHRNPEHDGPAAPRAGNKPQK